MQDEGKEPWDGETEGANSVSGDPGGWRQSCSVGPGRGGCRCLQCGQKALLEAAGHGPGEAVR